MRYTFRLKSVKNTLNKVIRHAVQKDKTKGRVKKLESATVVKITGTSAKDIYRYIISRS